MSTMLIIVFITSEVIHRYEFEPTNISNMDKAEVTTIKTPNKIMAQIGMKHVVVH